ncbi:hypothetical protein H0H93_004230 [Arthromyces matolae]|nr:hypothetical protein H0H93_004230 [Arthromyces matolae]
MKRGFLNKASSSTRPGTKTSQGTVAQVDSDGTKRHDDGANLTLKDKLRALERKIRIGNKLSQKQPQLPISKVDTATKNSDANFKDKLRSLEGKINIERHIKLPIGKVDTSLPEGYVAPKVFIKPSGPLTTDYPDDQPIMTTLPPRGPNEKAAIGANTWAECFFYGGKEKRFILSTPNFPTSVPHFDPPRYRIGPSEMVQGCSLHAISLWET